MTTYAARETINAPVETIRKLLTDASSYPEWNPTIVSLDGTIALGEKITLVSTVNPKRSFTLKITSLDAPRRMVWADGMPLGLFKGVRTYLLEPRGDGATDFSMEEVFSGILEPMISKSIPDMSDSLQQFAAGLKREAERSRD